MLSYTKPLEFYPHAGKSGLGSDIIYRQQKWSKVGVSTSQEVSCPHRSVWQRSRPPQRSWPPCHQGRRSLPPSAGQGSCTHAETDPSFAAAAAGCHGNPEDPRSHREPGGREEEGVFTNQSEVRDRLLYKFRFRLFLLTRGQIVAFTIFQAKNKLVVN